MLFNSMQFLVFFPIVTVAYYIIPIKIRWVWLLLSSYYFYMSWNPKYALLMAFSTVVTFVSGLCLEQCIQRGSGMLSVLHCRIKYKSMKKMVVAVCMVLNLSVLFLFKYAAWLAQSICYLLHIENRFHFNLLLPVGISFYTFQALGYMIDVYRGEVEAEKNLFKYALFVSFFPQLVAGPIERSKNLLGQISENHTFEYQKARDGMLIMLWGYFCKTAIADRAGVIVDTVFGNYTDRMGIELVLAAVLFSFQIYCDFMGYSLIAMGSAKVLGYDLMKNFNQPYFAASVKEFWHRWHISLSTWFRDYLYIPLGGGRTDRNRKFLNLMIVFGISGLWHGAGWSYVVWGLLNGLYQIAGELTVPIRKQLSNHVFGGRKIKNLLNIFGTFILSAAAWVFFRSRSLRDALNYFWCMATAEFVDTSVLMDNVLQRFGLSKVNIGMLAVGLSVLFIVSLIQEKTGELLPRFNKKNYLFRLACYWFIVIFLIFSLDLSSQEFIYFQF